MIVQSVLDKAAAFYDEEYLLRLTQEECGELVSAINHFLRTDRPEGREERLHQLREEVADVHKCIRVLWRILGTRELEAIDRAKAARWRDRMEQAEGSAHA